MAVPFVGTWYGARRFASLQLLTSILPHGVVAPEEVRSGKGRNVWDEPKMKMGLQERKGSVQGQKLVGTGDC